MKKIYLTIVLLISSYLSMSQDTVITNLQLRARTIKVLAVFAKQAEDTAMVKTFLSWNVQFKMNNPADNANVTIASVRTYDVGRMYEYLMFLPAGANEVEDFLGDFKTSIAPFRASNILLDTICDELEANQVLFLNNQKVRGAYFLNLQ